MKRLIYTLAIVIMASFSALAQDPIPFWSQDFAGGLPADWTASPQAPENIIWEYYAGPNNADPACTTYTELGCTNFYNVAAFASTSVGNGYMMLDSDAGLTAGFDSYVISELTTGNIDCSTYDIVSLKFQSRIGVFQNLADELAVVRVKAGAGDWTSFPIFSGVDGTTVATRYSDNPEVTIINISAIAAGQSDVQIQFQWSNNWDYLWQIDDIELFNTDITPPLPAISLAINNAFYPLTSYSTPSNQISCDTMGFFVTVTNKGGEDQFDVELRAEVLEGNTVLWDATVTADTIPAGFPDSLFILEIAESYIPDLGIGDYSIRYTLTSGNGADFEEDDNVSETPFVVSDFLFAKAPDATNALSPTGLWYAASFYKTCDFTGDYVFDEGSVIVATNDASLNGKSAEIYLLKIIDSVIFPDLSNLSDAPGGGSSQFDLVATGLVNFSGADFTEFDFDLEDINGDPNIFLTPNTRYLLVARYDGTGSLFHGYNSNLPYFNSGVNPVYTTGWFLGGFANGGGSCLSMKIATPVIIGTEDQLAESTIVLSPNPASDLINVGLKFGAATNADILIYDINGKIVDMQAVKNTTTSSVSFNTSRYPAGVYVARVTTTEGSVSRQFTVIK